MRNQHSTSSHLLLTVSLLFPPTAPKFPPCTLESAERRSSAEKVELQARTERGTDATSSLPESFVEIGPMAHRLQTRLSNKAPIRSERPVEHYFPCNAPEQVGPLTGGSGGWGQNYRGWDEGRTQGEGPAINRASPRPD